jgi:hypothetical protein
MASRNAQRLGGMAVVLLAAVSCRSILDIKPGHYRDDAAAGEDSNGGSSGGGTKSGGGTGGNSQTGGSTADAGTSNGGKSSGGKSSGGGNGGNATSGNANVAGEGMGGEGGVPATDPFPEGSCRNCMARNCATVAQACEDDPDCASQISRWLDCPGTDSSACVVADPGPLHDLAACGAETCDLCRHQSDGEPTIDILTPSNGAQIKPDANGLIEVSVQVKNFKVQAVGSCAVDDVKCGHIHLNLDGDNCHVTPFYNQVILAVDASGSADSAINTTACDPMKVKPIVGRPLALTASLSSNQTHNDRVPAVQATVTITVPK